MRALPILVVVRRNATPAANDAHQYCTDVRGPASMSTNTAPICAGSGTAIYVALKNKKKNKCEAKIKTTRKKRMKGKHKNAAIVFI